MASIKMTSAPGVALAGAVAVAVAQIICASAEVVVNTSLLEAPDVKPYDQFGWASALSADGTVALVAASPLVGSTNDAGAAYVFANNGGPSWSCVAELQEGPQSDGFGEAVSISGDATVAVIGAPAATVNGNVMQGAVYVYTPVARGWSNFTQMLVASDGQENNAFGVAVSTSGNGNVILIGASWVDEDVGAAYFFNASNRSNGTWVQVQRVMEPSGMGGCGFFGKAVAVSRDGGTAVVGATQCDAGYAYMYTAMPNGTWLLMQQLAPSGGHVHEAFGWSVALSAGGVTVAIGAVNADAPGVYQAGAAYIYTWNGTMWTHERKLTASDAAIQDWLGCDVAVNDNGTMVVAGACNKQPFGAAYVFGFNGTAWNETGKLLPPADAGSFANTLAVDANGSMVLAGAPGTNTDNHFDAGDAYVLTLA